MKKSKSSAGGICNGPEESGGFVDGAIARVKMRNFVWVNGFCGFARLISLCHSSGVFYLFFVSHIGNLCLYFLPALWVIRMSFKRYRSNAWFNFTCNHAPLPPPGQPPGQVHPFGPGGGELLEGACYQGYGKCTHTNIFFFFNTQCACYNRSMAWAAVRLNGIYQ